MDKPPLFPWDFNRDDQVRLGDGRIATVIRLECYDKLRVRLGDGQEMVVSAAENMSRRDSADGQPPADQVNGSHLETTRGTPADARGSATQRQQRPPTTVGTFPR
jgi:hypothetical protein